MTDYTLDLVSDDMADAAAVAFREFTMGMDAGPMSHRELGVVREAYRVAVAAALEKFLPAHDAEVRREAFAEAREALEAVLALHVRKHAVFSWQLGPRYEDPCAECDGKAGVHECGCWADSDIEYVCAECHRLGARASGVYDYSWPCPTVRAIESALGGSGRAEA